MIRRADYLLAALLLVVIVGFANLALAAADFEAPYRVRYELHCWGQDQ